MYMYESYHSKCYNQEAMNVTIWEHTLFVPNVRTRHPVLHKTLHYGAYVLAGMLLKC